MKNAVGKIVRHFKGGYYIITDIVNTMGNGYAYVYMPLNGSGMKFIRKAEEFFEIVKNKYPDEVFKFKQCTRFVEIKDITTELKDSSTEDLISELVKRVDNPYASINLESNDEKAWCVDFEVGFLHKRYEVVDDTELETEYFKKELTFETYGGAVDYVEKRQNTNAIIMKKVSYLMDFDS